MTTPHPYQRDGIDFLAARSRALLGDDAGLGKSLQLIRAAEGRRAERILVLAPAVGRISWSEQFEEWDTLARPVLQHPRDTKRMARLPDGPLALVVTYAQLSDRGRAAALRKLLDKSAPFEAAFLDEAHQLKSPSAARTRAIYGPRLDLSPSAILHGIPYIWAASATFTPLNAGELYPHLKALLPDVLRKLFGGQLPSAWEFTHRFCRTQETPFGTRVVGNDPAMIPLLRAALQPHFLMRTKAQVLDQLPPLTAALLPLDVPARGGALSLTSDAEVGAMSDEAFLSYLQEQAIRNPSHAAQRRELGQDKGAAVWPWITEFLDADPRRKLLVFAHHRAVLDALHLDAGMAGYEPCLLHGGVSQADARAAVARFQADPDARLFIGQTRAAGVAITLTAAEAVLLIEPDPSPLINYQAIARAHRMGQRGAVTAHFAYAATDPIDRRLSQVLRRRAGDHADLFGSPIPGAMPAPAKAS